MMPVTNCGGSKGFKYRASLNYIGEKGVILESGNDRYTANVNVDMNVEKYKVYYPCSFELQ